MIKKICIALMMFFVILACKDAKKGPNVKSTDNVETIFAVNTTKAVKGEISDYIQINGDIKAKTEVDVYPDTVGKLVQINVKIGQFVNKGQYVAMIDPSRPGMDFALSPVKSPISGTITDINGNIGETVSQQISVCKVGILNNIEIRSSVSEKFISKIKTGLSVLVKVEAYPENQFNGFISEVSPVINPNTRMMDIIISLKAYDPRLKPGMFAKLKVITEKKENIVKIPGECLVKRYGVNYVFVVKTDLTVEKRKITPGIQIDNKVEIVEGLGVDEVIVIRGQTLLEDKTKVKVIEQINPLTALDIIE